MILIHPYAQRLRNGMNNPKNYPFWNGLIARLQGPFIQIGLEGEAPIVEDFRKGLSMIEIQKLVRECQYWISVDSFLPHLAFHEAKAGVVLWGPSDPRHFGYTCNLNLLRDRKYLRPRQFQIWEEASFSEEAFLPADDSSSAIKSWASGQLGTLSRARMKHA